MRKQVYQEGFEGKMEDELFIYLFIYFDLTSEWNLKLPAFILIVSLHVYFSPECKSHWSKIEVKYVLSKKDGEVGREVQRFFFPFQMVLAHNEWIYLNYGG